MARGIRRSQRKCCVISVSLRRSCFLPFIHIGGSVPFGSGEQKKGTNMKTFLNMLRDDSGASAAEYALILAIVGSAIALAAIGLGDAVSGSINNAADCINTPGSC